MEQIEITDEALPILKSGIALKEKLLAVKAENYLKRLKNYEKKHKMKSSKFYEAFKAGDLGDDAECSVVPRTDEVGILPVVIREVLLATEYQGRLGSVVFPEQGSPMLDSAPVDAGELGR